MQVGRPCTPRQTSTVEEKTDLIVRLVNIAIPSRTVNYKVSKMPFVQMENISHFLRALQAPPFELPDHDVFLTVDLYEAKDPAQVLQCLSAFSRRASTLQPSRFKRTLGPRSRNAALSPQSTGVGNGWTAANDSSRARGASDASQSSASLSATGTRHGVDIGSGRSSENSQSATNGGVRAFPRGGISSWSKRTDEGTTAPAWNIYQYGYMGGASQGNQGISFGARRQITSSAPTIPGMADKERKRREEEEEEKERLRAAAEEEKRRNQLQREEEERERLAEEEMWREETNRRREMERLEAEREKEMWAKEERRRKDEEDRRHLEKQMEVEARLKIDGQKTEIDRKAGLNGQYLSQYLSQQAHLPTTRTNEEPKLSGESEKVRQLERELELARQREREYQAERKERLRWEHGQETAAAKDKDTLSTNGPQRLQSPVIDQSHHQGALGAGTKIEDESERLYLANEWNNRSTNPSEPPTSSHRETTDSQRPLPEPSPWTVEDDVPDILSRPLPDPTAYAPRVNRTDRFLAANPAPTLEKPKTHFPSELGFDSTAERHIENTRRDESQNKTRAGGWASKSLLEREMERERQRQQEWEEGQNATREAAEKGVGKGLKENTVGEGGSWDVNQYGWTGGDNQNRGGLSFGGRRQIIGPRPPPRSGGL